MPRTKIKRTPEYIEVTYDENHWKTLAKLRKIAINILRGLAKQGINAIVHGSIARGDVHSKSDIDVFIPYVIPSYKVELAIETMGLQPVNKYIVVATPSSTPKAYISLDPDDRIIISFPLAKLSPREYEFYIFGGLLDLRGLEMNRRVPGVDKRLVFIEPTEKGHRESPVIGNENIVAKKLGISVDTVLERVYVLSRRDKHGRTGVFVKYYLGKDESFEEALDRIAKQYPHVRRRLYENGFI
ncbi:MAG: DNA polymerase subunit beta [Crenarchaeota archaeon]|nr:DNA polymerase subunit beta [Thermoproteota archaeon]